MKLAIQGHPTRGKEIIKLLEMLGGVDWHGCTGNRVDLVYYISDSKAISFDDPYDIVFEDGIKEFITFTLEEFLEKFPYKVGDKVKNTCGAYGKVYEMKWINDEIQYRLDFGHHISGWYNVCELQSYKKETIEELNISKIGFNGDKARLILPDGYEFKAEGNEVFVIKNKPKYPKTYDECCQYLGCDDKIKMQLIGQFIRLINVRNAYWKIAGDEMGLGKPWEPDWDDKEQIKFIIFAQKGYIRCDEYIFEHRILAFPTKEMRDAFYKNFKELIEECKELV